MSKIRNIKNTRFNILLAFVMIIIMVVTVYPVWYSIINSLNSAQYIARNGFSILLPGDFTLQSWKSVLKNNEMFTAFGITISRTVLVTVLQTLITAMFAYGFSRSHLIGRKFYSFLGFTSMYLSGGIIAYFIWFNTLGLYNTFWVYVIPVMFGGFYNVIIFTTNFRAIPDSLFESAKMDGGTEYTIFFRIVMPLSKPVLSALAIFTAVATWNDYTGTLYYTRNPEIQTLSYYMLSITKSSASAAQLGESMSASASSILSTITSSAANYKTIELAAMVLSALPLVIIYPFAQRFFEKGVMIGSVKG